MSIGFSLILASVVWQLQVGGPITPGYQWQSSVISASNNKTHSSSREFTYNLTATTFMINWKAPATAINITDINLGIDSIWIAYDCKGPAWTLLFGTWIGD